MSILHTVEWARNERNMIEMTPDSMEKLIDQWFCRGYDQAVGEVCSLLRQQNDPEYSRTADRIERYFAAKGNAKW